MKLPEKHFGYATIFFTILLFSSYSFSQSNFSISGYAGLAAADGTYGRSLSVNVGIPVGQKSGFELGYNYLEFENEINPYSANRYSILMENFIFSSDDKFRLTSKTGPSLMVYDGHDSEDSAFGFDFGLESSYRMLGSLYIDFGFINTINKVNFMVQFYVGFSYDIPRKEKVE